MATIAVPEKAQLRWSNLWPAAMPAPAAGWTDALLPGVSVLVDETLEEAHHWLALLTGYALPGQGQVQCHGRCSQRDSQAYQAQVYWHRPRVNMHGFDRHISVLHWLQEEALRWPQWSDEAWQQHCQGFALAEHLSKPLWQLSTGTLRKLGLSAALASGAAITAIEEPIAALDAASIRYLVQALDALGEALSNPAATPRWVIVAHWEPLSGVTWDEILFAPSLGVAQSGAGPCKLSTQ